MRCRPPTSPRHGNCTPPTRSEHIKKLIEKEYITVSNDKKQVVTSTQKGRDLIALAPALLSTPDMTALWFEEQKMIESKELSLDEVLDGIIEQVTNDINNLKENKMEGFNKDAIKCPECNDGVLIRRQNKKGTWWWVTAPLWIPFVIAMIFLGFILAVSVFREMF